MRLTFPSSTKVSFEDADGTPWNFTKNVDASYTPEPGYYATLVKDASYYTLTFGDGHKFRFNLNSGRLERVVDKTGNIVQLTYDGNGRIIGAASYVTCSATASDRDHWTQGANSGNQADGIASYTGSAKRGGADVGTFPNGNTGSFVTWQAPATPGAVTITCTADYLGPIHPPNC